MARRPRRLVLRCIYDVTGRGVAQQPIYLDVADHLLFLRLLRGVVRHWHWTCYALCLMGNHYHVVVATTGPRLSAGMHRLNGVYAGSFNTKYRRSGHLFGDRFHTRVVKSEDDLLEVCRYVLANPVRAGLCDGWSTGRGAGAGSASSSRS